MVAPDAGRRSCASAPRRRGRRGSGGCCRACFSAAPAGGEALLVLGIERAGLEHLDQVAELDPVFGRRSRSGGAWLGLASSTLGCSGRRRRASRAAARAPPGGDPMPPWPAGAAARAPHRAPGIRASRASARRNGRPRSLRRSSGAASRRSITRSNDSIIWMREPISSVLLAPAKSAAAGIIFDRQRRRPDRREAWR